MKKEKKKSRYATDSYNPYQISASFKRRKKLVTVTEW